MDINSLIILGLCVVVLILMVVMYIKDSQSDKKFERFEQVLTDTMQENFIAKKELASMKKLLDDMDIGDFSDKIDEEIEHKIAPIIRSLQSIDEIVRKNMTTNDDEGLIISEYQSGKNIEEIAILHEISLSRIEFVLKLNKII